MMKRISNEALRDHFLGWQCRIRQIAVRQFDGQPMPAMQPTVWSRKGELLSQRMTILFIKAEPAESTAYFRHQLQRTHDHAEARASGLAFLAADYFQDPLSFSDEMTAVFPAASPLAATILAQRPVLLDFDQFSQHYRISCKVRRLKTDAPARQATLWHNRLFNPNLAGDAAILAFKPDWKSAEADPWPG
jgi:hypothetical protein